MRPADKGLMKPRKQLRKDAVPTVFPLPDPSKSRNGHYKPKRSAPEDLSNASLLSKKLSKCDGVPRFDGVNWGDSNH